MKFNVAGREVAVGFGHLMPVAGAFLLMIIAMAVASAALAFFRNGTDFMTSFLEAEITVGAVFSLVGAPITAYFMLQCGRFMKMKDDDEFCRAAATAMAALMIGLTGFSFGLLAMEESIRSGPYQYGSNFSYIFPLFGLPYLAGMVLNMATGAIVMYLWLLVVRDHKMENAKKAAVLGLLFALGLFLLDAGTIFAFDYSIGIVQPYSMGDTAAPIFISDFMFAFVILYHVAGKKLDMEAAWLFTCLYLGGTIFLKANGVMAGLELFVALADFGRAVASLALLYVISRSKDVLF